MLTLGSADRALESRMRSKGLLSGLGRGCRKSTAPRQGPVGSRRGLWVGGAGVRAAGPRCALGKGRAPCSRRFPDPPRRTGLASFQAPGSPGPGLPRPASPPGPYPVSLSPSTHPPFRVLRLVPGRLSTWQGGAFPEGFYPLRWHSPCPSNTLPGLSAALHRASPVPFRGSCFTTGLHPPAAKPQRCVGPL